MTKNDSPLFILGTWTMGGQGFGPYDQQHAIDTLNLFYEIGGRHFDTAHFYAKGGSDALLANFLKNKDRSDYWISTKGGLYWNNNSVYHDGSYKALKDSLEQSLRTFNTDYIDLYQLHWPDANTDIQESINALREFKSQGKIKAWGLSNPSLDHQAYFDCDDTCFTQLHFNPLHQETKDLLIKNKQAGFKTLITSPFEQGLLVNPSYLEKPLGKHDTRRRNPYFYETYHQWLQGFYAADRSGHSLSDIVLTWIFSTASVDSVLLGCRHIDQIKDSLSLKDSFMTLKHELVVDEQLLLIQHCEAFHYLNQDSSFAERTTHR